MASSKDWYVEIVLKRSLKNIMKHKQKHLFFYSVVCSLVIMFTACGSGGINTGYKPTSTSKVRPANRLALHPQLTRHPTYILGLSPPQAPSLESGIRCVRALARVRVNFLQRTLDDT